MFPKIISIIAISFGCFFVNQSQAWVMQAVYHNDAHPGKCYVNEHLILSPGQKARSPEGCSLIHCNASNGGAQVTGCGKIGSPPNCRWDGYENVNADFPICCVENFVCDNPEDEANAKNIQDNIREMFKRQWEEARKQ